MSIDVRTDLRSCAGTQGVHLIRASVVDEPFREDAGMAIGDCARQLCSLHVAFGSDSQVTSKVVLSLSSVWCSTTLVTLPASAFFFLVSSGRFWPDESAYLEHVDLSLGGFCVPTFWTGAIIPASLSVCYLEHGFASRCWIRAYLSQRPGLFTC